MKLDFSSDNSTIAIVEEDFAQNGHSENYSEKDTTALRAGIKAAQRGDRAEARQLLMRATEADPGSESAWLWLASISEYPEELLIFLNNVLDINPENERAIEWAKATKSLLAKTFVQRGIEAHNQDQKQFARQCFMQAIVHDNRNEMAWLWLASITDAAEEKVAHFNRVLEINPENEQARESIRSTKEKMMQAALAKAENAFDTDDREKAEKYLEEVFGFTTQNEDAWLLKSRMAESFEEKTSSLEKVLELNSGNKKALEALETAKQQRTAEYFEKADDAFENGDNEQAEDFLAEVFELDPEHENAWFLKSHLTDSFEEKTSCLEKVLEINPENEQAKEAVQELENGRASELFKKANETANEGNRELANEYLDEVLGQNPHHEDAWILKSRMTDSFEEKLSYFERILEFNPENETAQAGVKLRAMLGGNAQKTEETVSFVNEETAEETVTEEYSNEETQSVENPFFSEIVEEENQLETIEPEAVEPVQSSENENSSVASFEGDVVSATDATEEFNYFVEPSEVYQAEESAAEKVEENYFVEAQEVEENKEEAVSEFEKPEDVFAEYSENYGVENFSTNGHSTAEFSESTLETAEEFRATETSENGFHHEMSEPENSVEEASAEPEMLFEKPQSEMKNCPFCEMRNDAQAFVCVSCRALLTLSDMEMILAYNEADQSVLREAVENMEVEDIQRGLESDELVMLAIGHINLKNLRKGLDALQRASRLEPNNVLIESQAHSLAIRLAEIEEKDSIHSSQPKDRTIMVVDDSATVRKLISGKLEKCGHIVITAVDGMDAMAKLNDVVPDLILLDITMPRMDGYQVCKLIRNNDAMKEVPVVMISGKDGFFDKVRGRMAGTTGYITKPFGPETLMKMLDTYLV